MQTLIGYLIGVIVAGMILFTVMFLQIQGSKASIDAEQYRAGKTTLLDLIAVMEQDFNNIGSALPAEDQTHLELQDAISYPDTNNVSGKTVYGFQFKAQPTPTSLAQIIRYEWWEDGTVNLDRGTVAVFTMERKVNGAVTARSTRMITFFNLQLLLADVDPATGEQKLAVPNAYDAQQIRVHLFAVSPLGSGDYVEELHWKKLIAPHNLTRLRN